jgi:preprotein translocase subunit Sec61beta
MADKISLPKSGGGLVSYKDEYKSRFIFPPVVIVVLIVVVIVVEFLIHKLF